MTAKETKESKYPKIETEHVSEMGVETIRGVERNARYRAYLFRDVAHTPNFLAASWSVIPKYGAKLAASSRTGREFSIRPSICFARARICNMLCPNNAQRFPKYIVVFQDCNKNVLHWRKTFYPGP
jgi:hypothetical protein